MHDDGGGLQNFTIIIISMSMFTAISTIISTIVVLNVHLAV